MFLLLFHVADFYGFQKSWTYVFLHKSSKNKIISYINSYRVNHSYSVLFDKKEAYNQMLRGLYRPIENKNKDKSILIFGCSYAYGHLLDDKETISYLLGKNIPHYRVYNSSISGWSTSHMLYQLENKDFSDIPDVKYVIYIFIPDHIVRNTCQHYNMMTPFYKLKSDNLYLEKCSLKYINIPLISYIFQIVKRYSYEKNFKNIHKIELTKKILEKSKLESEFEFGTDTKFIIFRYDRGEEELCNYMFEELKREGFIIVTLNDLSKTNYLTPKYQISETDIHPNAIAWQEITTLFVKYLQDRGYFKE